MKIAISGAPTTGKTALVKQFLNNWKGYKEIKQSKEFTDLLVPESRLDIEKLDKIFNGFVDNAMFYEGKNVDIVHDGSILDGLAHIYLFFMLHPEAKNDVLQKYQALFRTAVSFYDVIFYIPFNNKINMENDKTELTEEEFWYYSSLDNVYWAFFQEYLRGNTAFFPVDSKQGCPPVIQIVGNPEERMMMLQLYINKDGTVYGKEDSLIGDFVRPVNKVSEAAEKITSVSEN